MAFDRRILQHFDWVMLSLVLILPLLGLLVLYSAGYDPDGRGVTLFGMIGPLQSVPFAKQTIFFLAGIVSVAVALLIPPAVLHRVAYPFYGVCLLLLVAVLIPGIGTVVNGSRRWISFGAFNIQPSEFIKLGLAMALARYISRAPPPPQGYSFKDLLIPSVLTVVPMVLIKRQPDLGTALSLGAIGFGMMLFAGIERRRLMVVAGLVGVVVALLFVSAVLMPQWWPMKEYQRLRIVNLFDPESNPRGAGYHIIQSIIAVGSGGLIGKGFLNGSQTQLEFLPEHHTDFIFSVLAEEWGFVGCIVVLALYFLLLMRMLRIVSRTRDIFSALCAFGITMLMFAHTVINVGMVIGVLPVVGIPLKLFSYGGSSLISTMFCLGVVLSIHMRRFTVVSSR